MVQVLYLIGLTIVLFSCKKDDPDSPDIQPAATSIQIVSGDNQAAYAGTMLANPVEVIVKDQDGQAFQGATVTFGVNEGSVSASTKNTDAAGKASITWTLGSTQGTQALTVTAFKADGTTALTGSPLSVTATANAILEASSIELVSGENQSGMAETILTDPLKILVKDQDGNPFPGADVQFAVSEGAVSSSSETTDANGNASVTWTLGATEGDQTLTVTSFKADGTTPLTGSPLSVTATANFAASIELSSGGNQDGEIRQTLENPVVVMVKDQKGDPFPGITVHLMVGEGSLSSTSEITDANGEASFEWTLGSTIGTQDLEVSAFQSDGTTHLAGSPLTVSANGTPETVTDYDGNKYLTAQIGNQLWMAENLKVTHYSDGTGIPLVTDNTEWANLIDNDSDMAYCYYNNDPNSVYGALYTSAAARNGAASSGTNPSGVQGVCPAGWHLPSNSELTQLAIFLTGDLAGGKLKSTDYWAAPNTGATNESGFSGLPAGFRNDATGLFENSTYEACFHSSYQTSGTTMWIYRLLFDSSTLNSVSIPKSGGYSVRCVKN